MFGDFIKKVQINHTLVKYPRDIFIIFKKNEYNYSWFFQY